VVFLVVPPCSFVNGYRLFIEHAVSIFRTKVTSTLKIEAVCFSKIRVSTYNTARCHDPEHYNLNSCRHEYLYCRLVESEMYFYICNNEHSYQSGMKNRRTRFLVILYSSRWSNLYTLCVICDCLSCSRRV
jgi:hypothetical protein